MLQREMEKEDTKSSRKRKEAKHNYAAKVLKYRTQIRNIDTEYKTEHNFRYWVTWAHWER